MNKTKIEWCDYTWSPVTGCKTGCFYCYAERMYKRFGRSFEPEFHPDRLNDPFKVQQPSNVFVCSVADLFGPWVPRDWQAQVLRVCACAPQHNFLFLTKWPKGMVDLEFPPNCWAGLTLDMGKGQGSERAALDWFGQVDAHRFLSFEPLLYAPPADMNLWNIELVIIGAMTGPGAKKYPVDPGSVERILEAADRYEIPVFMKNNLRPYWSGVWRRELPKEWEA